MKIIKTVIFLALIIGFVECSSESSVSPRTNPPIITNILDSDKNNGGMKVTSIPNDAAIFIDGVDSGKKTPYSFYNIKTREYVIKVKIEGYKSKPDSMILIIPEGKRIGAHFDLTKK